MVAMLELIVAVAAAYWGWFYASRGRRLYGAIVGIAGLAAAMSSFGGDLGISAGSSALIGALGTGACVLLLVVGPLCRATARAVVQSDRLKLAGALLEIADVLMPGAGVGDDKLALAALRDVRAGKIDDTVAALEHGKTRLPRELGRAIDERITMLYLSAHRWKDAIDHADRNLMPNPPPRIERPEEEDEPAPRPPEPEPEPEPESESPSRFRMDVNRSKVIRGRAKPSGSAKPPATQQEAQDAWAAARAALGMSPPLWVEVLGAVAREGDLDRAANMLRELEAACGGRDDAFWIVHRGRLVFLAFAGRTAAVDRLVAPDVARHMTRSARSYWRGIAAAQAGDAAAAEGAYNSALAGSRGRARELVTRALDDLPKVKPQAASELVRETADAAEAAPLARPQPVARQRRLTTLVLVAINIAITATIAIVLGAPSDPAVVVRAGGALRGAIDHGEWWRLVSTTMVHIGVVHLTLNMLALLALGRWTESIFGSRPVAAIYALAGIAGSAASYLFGSASVSAGASGAIFGLLGAFMIELVLHRRAYQRVWQSGMMGALLIAFAAQMALGYSLPQDQLAHVGGLVAGALAGIALSPHRKARRAVKLASTVIAAIAAAAAVVAIVMVVRTDFADTLARYPLATRVVDDVAVTVPARWSADAGEYHDPDLYIAVQVARTPAGTDWAAGEPNRSVEARGFEHVEVATDRVLALPPGWTAKEWIAFPPEDELVDQRYRVVAAQRADGIAASVYVPDALAVDAGPQLTAILASIVDRRAPAER